MKHLSIIITVLAPYVCVSLCVYLSLCVVCVNVSGCVTNRRREVKGSVFHRKLRAEKETGNTIAFGMEANSQTVSVALVIWAKGMVFISQREYQHAGLVLGGGHVRVLRKQKILDNFWKPHA